jgi:O-antigen/teichoic acid export membrane protein
MELSLWFATGCIAEGGSGVQARRSEDASMDLTGPGVHVRRLSRLRKTFHRVVLRTRIGRRLALLAGSAAIGQLAMLIATPMVTRLYGPTGFGVFVALTGLSSMLAVFSAGRYEAAIPLCRRDEDATALAWVVVLASAAFALLIAVLLWMLGRRLSDMLGLGAAGALLWWVPPILAVQGLFLAFDAWALYQRRMRQLAASKILQGLVVAFCQVAFGLLGDGDPQGLLLAWIIGQLCGILPMLLGLSRAQRTLFAHPDRRLMLLVARRYRHFPMYEMWSRSVSNAAEMLPPLLTATVFGAAASGLFGLAQRIVGLPIRFVGIAASQVYIAELAALGREPQEVLRKLFAETVRRLLVAGLIYLGVVVLFGPWLFMTVFGSEWSDSGHLARLLAPMYLAMFINRPIRYTVQFYERQDLGLYVSITSLAVVLVAFLLAHLNLADLWLTVLLMSVGLCVTNLCSYLLARALIVGRLAGRPNTDAPLGSAHDP